MNISKESPINREKAREILLDEGSEDSFDPNADYYLVWADDGSEYLSMQGEEIMIARNKSSTSWC